MSLKSKIESLLYISNHPLSFKKLAELTDSKVEEVKMATEELIKDYNQRKDGGINIQKIGNQIQMVTSTDNSKIVKNFIKDETTGELTPAQLETLTVIAYRGPITRAELEQIRGVNCAIILRHLMIRGLISAEEDKEKMQTVYQISFDFLRYLGLTDVSQLPNYEKLRSDDNLQRLLEQNVKETEK